MSIERKRTLIFAWLVLFLAWPLLHLAASRVARIDPWKLCGFAMYAAPHPEYTMEMTGEPAEGGPLVAAWPPEVRQAGGIFLERRKTFGRMVRPRRLAATAFDAVPRLERVRIVVKRRYLDPSSARIAEESDVYAFVRPAPAN